MTTYKVSDYIDLLERTEAVQPMAIVKDVNTQDWGLLVVLSESINKNYLVGDFVVFWKNGGHSDLDDDAFIEVHKEDFF
jgi:signal peptidase I